MKKKYMKAMGDYPLVTKPIIYFLLRIKKYFNLKRSLQA